MTTHLLLRAPAVLAALLPALAPLPAAADSVTALAYQNLGQQVQDTGNGAEAFASYGQATAYASRSQVIARTEGNGAGPQTHFGASAGSTSHYSLWDLGENLPLAADVAARMELAFNFELVGLLMVDETPQSVASTRYVGGVDYIGGQDNFQGALSVSYGHVFPFPTTDYTFAGDGGLFGGYALSFTARHRGATDGVITFTVANTSANAAKAASSLTLVSVGLLDGTRPDGGLGIRIAATGQIIPVGEVPEPATWALWLLGLAGLAGLACSARTMRLKPALPGTA